MSDAGGGESVSFKAVAPGRSIMFQWVSSPHPASVWIAQIIVDGLLHFSNGDTMLGG